MKIFDDPKALQDYILSLKATGQSIGFVPTMGNLHEGHLSLIDIAKEKSDVVVASIYVNPLQFGPNEDFDNYPRTLDDDKEKLITRGTDILFLPTTDMMYPKGMESHTKVLAHESLTNKLCGASRPGHFDGVATVVTILFQIVQPNVAVFGKKDFQQLSIIQTMVNDLRMPIEIIGGEIAREPNGLAMSSRNGYLTEQEKDHASHLRATIIATQKQIEAGDKNFTSLEKNAKQQLEHDGFTVDYFEIVNPVSFEKASDMDKDILIAAAAWLGKPRLIDNQEVRV